MLSMHLWYTVVMYCNERLKAKTEGSTRLTYTGLHGGLGHKDRDEVKRKVV
jgi:hypothetical protein